MKPNPYSKALFSIGAIGLALVFVSVLGGFVQQNNGDPGAGIGLFALASSLFPVASIAFIAWLLVEGLRWPLPAPRPTAPPASLLQHE